MKISQIVLETTTAGSIATVSEVLGTTQSRLNVKGLKPINQLGGKKKGPYANSLNEGAMKQLSMDLKELKDDEFKQKYGKTKQEARAALKAKPEPVSEAKLEEDDIILVPGQGRKFKPGFHKIDPDKAEHEGQTLKNSLHTIIRVATALDKELSTRDNFPEWVSEKIGATKGMMVAVAEYLQSAKEMQHDPDAIAEAGGAKQYSAFKREWVAKHGSGAKVPGYDSKEYTSYCYRQNDKKQGVGEGAKVDRMVKHVAQSEKKLGHSAKEAENIAWATANKRGMLDNKNKKKAK